MKLAELLAQRKVTVNEIQQLSSRSAQNCVQQEGTLPVEDPTKLLKATCSNIRELEKIKVQISEANRFFRTESGQTISEALAARETLKRIASLYTAMILQVNMNPVSSRYSAKEVINVATVDVTELRKQLDKISQQRRKIETELQQANWTCDLSDMETSK